MSADRSRLRDPFRRIMVWRHESELSTLRAARWFWPMSVFPIFANLVAWWLLAVLPIVFVLASLGTVGVDLFSPPTHHSPAEVVLHLVTGLPLSACGLVMTILAARWFFRWHLLAVALTFGRAAMADRREAELAAAIAEAERAGLA